MNKTKTIFSVLSILLLANGCAMFKKSVSDANQAVNQAEQSIDNAETAVAQATAGQSASAGRAIAAEVMRKYPMISDKAQLEYVNRVGQYVALHLNTTEKSVRCSDGKAMVKPAKGIRVAIISSDATDAFTVPGGFVFVPSGLVAKLRSEDQLAGVIAHELMHTMCGVDMPADVAAAATNPGSLVSDAMTKPYTRSQLNAADRAAIVALYRAGYYPNHYIRHVYENEEVGKHTAGKARTPAMQKDVAKLASKIEKTVDARRARYERFQRAVLTAASKASTTLN